jgi:hypothetical protein
MLTATPPTPPVLTHREQTARILALAAYARAVQRVDYDDYERACRALGIYRQRVLLPPCRSKKGQRWHTVGRLIRLGLWGGACVGLAYNLGIL